MGHADSPPSEHDQLRGAAIQIRNLLERERAWKKLVRHLINESGSAPPYEARGLWVDLYDEVTMSDHSDGADDGH